MLEKAIPYYTAGTSYVLFLFFFEGGGGGGGGEGNVSTVCG